MKVSAISRAAIFATLLGLSLSQSGYAAQAAPASGSVSVWVDANSTNPCVAKVVTAANKNSNLKINFALKKGWEAATKYGAFLSLGILFSVTHCVCVAHLRVQVCGPC